jgi:hypothetical protein
MKVSRTLRASRHDLKALVAKTLMINRPSQKEALEQGSYQKPLGGTISML